jgi:GTPase subunit of restriction endonuclease
MNVEELNKDINAMKEESKKLSAIYSDDNKVIEYINGLPESRIDELIKLYGTSTKLINQSSKDASAANIVRFVLLKQLKADKEITLSSIDQVKKAFLEKDLEFFKKYLDESIIEKINQYAKKDPFGKLWGKPFSLLHTFIISPLNFRLMLKQLTSRLLDELDLTDYKTNEFDFTGARNEGAEYAWFAIFPKKMDSHQNAYRLSCVFKEGVITTFLDAGWNVIDDEEKRNIKNAQCNTYQEMFSNFQQWKDELIKLNAPLLKSPNTSSGKDGGVNEGQTEYETEKIPLNQILYGPPGTGKTYNTVIKSMEIIGGEEVLKLLKSYESDSDVYKDILDIYNSYKAKGQIKFITFHQNYSYEEFIEGIMPDLNKGTVSYKLNAGPLKEIAEKASKDLSNKYVLVIDEINRGNISKIFGELITLLEEDKRYGNRYAISMPLMYSKEEFSLPKNLYIIGTMNTADKSIALVDVALRRRFSFIETMPKEDLIEEVVDDVLLQDIVKTLNKKIAMLFNRDHQIGQSYFMNITNLIQLKNKWFKEILPLLNEYFYGDWEKLKLVLSDSFIKPINEPSLKDVIDESWTFKEMDDMDDEQFKTEMNNIAVKK